MHIRHELSDAEEFVLTGPRMGHGSMADDAHQQKMKKQQKQNLSSLLSQRKY